jgi:hypothetical protein
MVTSDILDQVQYARPGLQWAINKALEVKLLEYCDPVKKDRMLLPSNPDAVLKLYIFEPCVYTYLDPASTQLFCCVIEKS